MNVQLHISSDSLAKKEWEKLCPNENSFLSLSFKKAFEKYHQDNIKHLYYIINEGDNKGIGYAQQFNVKGNSIHNYQKKNNISNSIVGLILRLLNLKVVALGNGLLTNISNLSANNLTDKKNLFRSIIKRIQTDLNVGKFIIPDHFFKELSIDKPTEMFPELIRVNVDEDMQMNILSEWKTFDDYTQALKKKYRSRLKSVLKKSEDIEIKPLTKEYLKKHADRIQELFVNVHQKSAFGIAPFNTFIYSDLIELEHPKCMVFGYFLEHKMIAFSSELRDQTTLYSYFIGLDYQYNRSHRIYERILNQTIKGAIENQKSKIIFGRTAAEFKSNVGAKPIASKIYIHLENPILRALLRPVLSTIKPGKWTQRNPFK